MSGTTITNSGTIGLGETLIGDTTLLNEPSGLITSPDIGVLGSGAPNAVINAGDILGVETGISLIGGGSVINQASGTIAGQTSIGVWISGSGGTVVNEGAIEAGQTGVILSAGGTVTNAPGGRITAIDGIRIEGGAGTIAQAGSIDASGGTAIGFASGFDHRLILSPGATTLGLVEGGNSPGGPTSSTLELAAGPGTGTIAALGSQFVNFGQILVDTAATWVMAGGNSLTAQTTLTNQGTLTLDGGTLTGGAAVMNAGTVHFASSQSSIGALSGGGVIDLGQQATLTIAGTVDAAATIDLSHDTGRLRLDNPFAFQGLIDSFSSGDIIDLPDTMVANAATILAGNTLSVALAGSASPLLLRLDPTQDFTGLTVTVSNDEVGIAPPCFRAGTRIMTARGPVVVESLSVGDLVLTAGPSGDGIRPIRWIGWRSVDCTRHPDPTKVWPVRIPVGAFGPGVPARDLWLSPDHAVYVDGVLIPVKHLVDGVIITQEPTESVRYFHIELPYHDVLLAEGLPCETYLDAGDRSNFENGGSVIRLHPDFARGLWEAGGCAPLHVTGPVVSRTRAAVRDRADRKSRRRRGRRAAE